MLNVNTISHGDCFELVGQVDDESVDLIVCDGPYGVTQHAWDQVRHIQECNLSLIQMFARVLKPGGALYLFGKPDCLDFIDYRPYLNLNSRIVWYQPSRLAQGRSNFTNNYDIIAYFTKGKAKTFNLDAIRVPQLVELEHRLRVERVPSVVNGKFGRCGENCVIRRGEAFGDAYVTRCMAANPNASPLPQIYTQSAILPKFGKTRFSQDGKNPGDVWGDIKQLTYKSHELLNREYLNTVQKPHNLIERIVKANSNEGDLVLDPFAGVGTTPAVCAVLNRNFLAFELYAEFVRVSQERLQNIRLEQEWSLF